MHGRFGAVDEERENLFVAQLERLDHDREQRPILVDTARRHGDRAGVARAGDLKGRVGGELVADTGKVAAHARLIESEQEPFGPEPIRHRVISPDTKSLMPSIAFQFTLRKRTDVRWLTRGVHLLACPQDSATGAPMHRTPPVAQPS